ncbi:MAG: preprotein translocase subunit SecY [Oscillospiraceae bacterium]|nr:preprotein translocase subunit SecY [Oscillospiraceae bacterium]
MLKTLRNAWKIIDLRKKILFTLFMILLYRLGNAVPVPYINRELLAAYFDQFSNTVLGLYNVMSGSSFSQATVFALSIQPYINASIIIQLLTIAIPALERLSKEGGEEGKKKIERITRYSTVGLALLQGIGYYTICRANGLVSTSGIWEAIVIVMTLVAGSSIIMWMGEQITEFGIGNGISIILFVGIVSRVPVAFVSAIGTVTSAGAEWWKYLLIYLGVLIGAIAMIVLIVIVTEAERRIPVQYSKRVVGRKVYGGQATHLPLKVNMSGVLPVIFAQSIASLPATIAAFVGKTKDSGGFWGGLLTVFDTNTVLYMVIYFLLIIFFSYFYSTIQFNPVEVSNNLRNNGGYIPGFRPGRPTSDFIAKVLNKVTLFGAVYLGIVAIVPLIVNAVSETAARSGIAVGGTSLIILVGVALETVKGMEAQMVMRNYKGFLE